MYDKYIHTGDISVLKDIAESELSFIVNEVNIGVVFEEIPIDKHPVPYVLLKNEVDFVDL